MARLLRTTSFAEPAAVSDVLKFEAGTYSRDTVTVASGAGVLPLGMVLGKITASGKWKAHTNGATDGSEVARGVLLQVVDATSADVLQAVIVGRHAEVSALGLKWHASVDDATKKAAAMAQLATAGIVSRASA